MNEPAADAIDFLFATRQDRKQHVRPAPDPGPAVADGEPVEIANPVKYAEGALTRAADDLAELAQAFGRRNDGLNEVAFGLGKLVGGGLLDHDETEAWLEHEVSVWPDTDPRNVTGTIRSGLRGGEAKPLAWVDAPAVGPAAPFLAAVPTVPAAPDATEATMTLEEAQAARHERLVTQYAADLRARDDAKRLVDAEKAARDFRVPPSRFTLADELLIPEEPVTYAIDDVLPTGANALLTAAFKTGKTTVVGDLARAYADGTRFLDRFDLARQDGRIAVFNYELSDGQYRRWLRELGIVDVDRVCVLHLRGFRLPVVTKPVEDWVVRWLADRDVRMWVVDPFARAFTGCGNENDNGEVGLFLDTLDVIKARAGVNELILPTHTGRVAQEVGQERARGATRLDDWADVRWMLNKGEAGPDDVPDRFFSATGRDVEVGEEQLHYDERTRRLRMSGRSRSMAKTAGVEEAVLHLIRANPGIGANELVTKSGKQRAAVKNAIERLEGARKITVDRDRKPFAHRPGAAAFEPSVGSDD